MSAIVPSSDRLPIRAAVRAARRRWRLARAAECLMLAAAAAGIQIAAGALSGAAPLAPPLLAAAALAGGLCGATWWFEHRRSERDVARAVDRKLGLDGALATALEVEAGAEPGSLAALLVERAARAVPSGRAAKAIAPPSPLFAAAPLIAGAVLALSLERSPASQVLRPPAGPPLGGLIAAREPARGEDTRDGALAELVSPAPALEGGREVPEPRGAAPVRVPWAEPTSDPLRGSERSRESEPRPLDPQTPEPIARADSKAPPLGDASPGARGGGESGAATSAEGASPGTGTAAGAASPSDPAPAAGVPRPDDEERGTLAGRWWPRRHDAVVAGWVEARRARAAAAGGR
ncbi:MAG TPA: hypothetical protein VMS76_04195 [Planctomycetota bacterium]|nr:hypothetical protein [Planctomycetota bacterium]